jgi:hypothetical protein
MKHLKNIEQLANAIKELDMNGLKIEAALVHLKVDGQTYREIEQEFKNTFSTQRHIVNTMKLGVEFNDISFIILFPRS